jgi:hypothetical protein
VRRQHLWVALLKWGMPRKLLTQDSFHCAQPFRDLEAATAMVQGGWATAVAGGRPWCGAHNAGFSGMQNASYVVHPDLKKGLPGQALVAVSVSIQKG